jgi:hypothetical protein
VLPIRGRRRRLLRSLSPKARAEGRVPPIVKGRGWECRGRLVAWLTVCWVMSRTLCAHRLAGSVGRGPLRRARRMAAWPDPGTSFPRFKAGWCEELRECPPCPCSLPEVYRNSDSITAPRGAGGTPSATGSTPVTKVTAPKKKSGQVSRRIPPLHRPSFQAVATAARTPHSKVT